MVVGGQGGGGQRAKASRGFRAVFREDSRLSLSFCAFFRAVFRTVFVRLYRAVFARFSCVYIVRFSRGFTVIAELSSGFVRFISCGF